MNKIKKVYCMPHSHFDLGYTHPQELILSFQEEYVNQAMELCEKYQESSTPYRWTIEATLPLLNWLQDAKRKDIERLKCLIDKKLISVTALLMHTTPLNNAFLLKKMLEYKSLIEEKLDIRIHTAINHDINGQPWSFCDLLLDAGVDFYLTGENIHFGGIPFDRPQPFYWNSQTNRQLLCFLGEHYSLFSQFLHTEKRDISKMREGLDKYLQHLGKKNYATDFVFLTATNPPLFDNNCPDFELHNLVQEFNATYNDIEISFVTPEFLKKEIENKWKNVDLKVGDWTDYWNFGSISTPQEIIQNRIATQNIIKAGIFESFSAQIFNRQYQRLREKSILNNLLYNEHTWGAASSISDPYSVNTISQKIKKKSYAYDSLAQSAYLLNHSFDKFLNEKVQKEKITSIAYTNTTSFEQTIIPKFPKNLLENSPYLSALKSNIYLHSHNIADIELAAPSILLEPYETKKVLISEFHECRKTRIDLNYEQEYNMIDHPFYKITINTQNGEIKEIIRKKDNRNLIAQSEYGFFDLVLETINENRNTDHRDTFFPRNIELANYSISVWNHDWKATREVYGKVSKLNVYYKNEHLYIECLYNEALKNISWFKKVLIFDLHSELIKVNIKVKKMENNQPNAHYLTIPLNLREEWECMFESADSLVALDKEQLENVSKDWITIGNSVSFHNDGKGILLGTATSPLVQFNEFSFGKENENVKRKKNPIILSWIYNNYWDTNFNVSDEGITEYSYLLQPIDEYRRIDQIKLGVRSSNPVERNWSDNEKIIEKPLDYNSKHSAILSIERIAKNQLQVFVKNYSLEVEEFTLTVKKYKVKSAYLSDVDGKLISKLSLNGNQISSVLDGNQFAYILIDFL